MMTNLPSLGLPVLQSSIRRLGVLIALTVLLAILGMAVDPPGLQAEPLIGTRDAAARQQIQTLFADARSRVTAGDGAGVLSLVSRATLARVEAVHTASRVVTTPLAGLGPSEKLAARTLRRFVPAAQLRRQPLSELVSKALTQHWLDSAMVDNTELGIIAVNGTHASAPVLVRGRPALVRAEFVRDGGRWRIDLTPTLTATDGLLRMFAGLSGQSEDEYIEKLVGRLRPR